MRYRLTRSTQKQRGQILTPQELAKRVVESMTGRSLSWLELGFGTGRLADAAFAAHDPGTYCGIDVDVKLLAKALPDERLQLHVADVLSPASMNAALGDQLFDRSIGNPPYGMQAASRACQDRIAELCPGIPQVCDWVQLDLYFVLESLARLRRGGQAAFIVGSPIAEDVRLTAFRRALIETASEVECYELPERAFGWKAQVQSYLLVARFGVAPAKKVRLARLAPDTFDVVAERWITPESATRRLDFAFHAFESLSSALHDKPGTRTLRELGGLVVRGSRTRAQFSELGIRHFHTSDFPRNENEIRFADTVNLGFQFAREGDILIPRVGTRCMGRQAVITDGGCHFTEAVFRVKVPSRYAKRVSTWMASDSGATWRRSAATGSCAKHLTVQTLMQMPIPKA